MLGPRMETNEKMENDSIDANMDFVQLYGWWENNNDCILFMK